MSGLSLSSLFSPSYFSQRWKIEKAKMNGLSLFFLYPSEKERLCQAGRICYRRLIPDGRAMTLASGGSLSTILAGFRLRQAVVPINTVFSGFYFEIHLSSPMDFKSVLYSFLLMFFLIFLCFCPSFLSFFRFDFAKGGF